MPRPASERPQSDPVPLYYLYGEAPDDRTSRSVHIETIPLRSKPHDWTIGAHIHPAHHQILLLSSGRASAMLDDQRKVIAPPSVVVIPADTVHGFDFEEGTDGYVLTVAKLFIDEAIEGDIQLAQMFTGPGFCVGDDVANKLHIDLEGLSYEMIGAEPGRRIAIKLHIQRILIALARHGGHGRKNGGVARSRSAVIVARYRRLIEQSFRKHLSLDVYAQELGVSVAYLNVACRTIMARSAQSLVHDRMMIEAKRALLYTAVTVAEVAESLGFNDPAYFNRFFSRRAGMSPGAYRQVGRLGN